MKTQLKFAIALAVILTQAACSHHNPKTSDNTAANVATLNKAFQGIDSTYSAKDTNLANKIEGISLDSNGKPARGIIQGQILVTGQPAPVHYYSDAFDTTTLKNGSTVDIQAELPDNWDVGGPLTGTFTCLNDDCSKAGVYFRFYEGAGYIFQQQKDGTYKLVTSVGKTVSLDQAMAKRGLALN